ncbi:1-deoxy-D-xylulose-5-phosphate synthase [Lachnospiraceae bacterium MD335]|jgi:1-deoxy-D-xylulose-5-phosphate synthase|nr:1-deoxy-D-xylulose-5-phosphate synthase [Lachnospiraceae bacterium MD335]NDO48773.1 1-deoxy-D-xylulose-5-phosphate synthase [Lachnospiraceae bacterium MD335]
MILERIEKENDIKDVAPEDYDLLAEEIREFLINKISVTGGHLGSNLGTVELTMALHLSLNLPKDKIVWDVGHQSYTHKLLTGRRAGFERLRKYGGMSGFPKRKESECDCFDTGHSSTSVSAGLGLVKARDLKGEDSTVVSVIGDGSLTGGMAYEALNNAARIRTNYIIVLNDNNMSISENVGGMSKYLNNIRTADKYLDIKEGVYNSLMDKKLDSVVQSIRRAKSSVKHLVIPGMFFEDMGITYLGPVDGHNINAMLKVFREAKRCKSAVLVHVLTQKGKGFAPAERHPARFHGAEPFDVETGLPLKPKTKSNYTDVFSTVMCKLGDRNEDIVAITAAMPDGTGLKRFKNMYPDRFFDVGIAEEHAVTFAAGLAAGGMKPVVAIYSSFLQRAYDQILHDVCIQNLPVVFAIDRAGLVGSDGETHQGIFDLSYLSSIPNMHIMAPKNKWELSDMLKFAVGFDGPVALRYPRGEAYDGLKEFREPIVLGKAEWLLNDRQIVLIAVGSMVKTALEVRSALAKKGYGCSIINARFVKPIDTGIIDEALTSHELIVTMEENVASGGFGEKVRDYLAEKKSDAKLVTITIPDEYVEHGNVDILRREVGIDTETIVRRVTEAMEGV